MKQKFKKFPGGLVVRIPWSGFNPWLGNWDLVSHAVWQKKEKEKERGREEGKKEEKYFRINK